MDVWVLFVEFLDDSEWKKLVPWDKVKEFKDRALNPHGHAVTRGGAENDDIYFQGREAQNEHFNNVLPVAIKYFKKVLLIYFFIFKISFKFFM